MAWKSAGFPRRLEILLTRLSTNCLVWSGWELTFALGESTPSSGGKHSGLVSSPFTARQEPPGCNAHCLLLPARSSCRGRDLKHCQPPRHRTESSPPGFAAAPIQLCRVPQGPHPDRGLSPLKRRAAPGAACPWGAPVPPPEAGARLQTVMDDRGSRKENPGSWRNTTSLRYVDDFSAWAPRVTATGLYSCIHCIEV